MQTPSLPGQEAAAPPQCLLILTAGALEVHTAHGPSSMQLAPGAASHPQLRKLQQALADAQDTPRSLISAVGHQMQVPHLPLGSLGHLQFPGASDHAPSDSGSPAGMQQAPDSAPTPRNKSFSKQLKSLTKKLSKLSSGRVIAPSAHSSSGAGSEAHAPAVHAGQHASAAGSDSGSFTFSTAPNDPRQQTPVLGSGVDAEHVSSLVISLQQAGPPS